jgi:hypothetical protein
LGKVGDAPYFFASSVYANQEDSLGISSKLPITGNGRGPGGYGDPPRLRWSRKALRAAKNEIMRKKSTMDSRETMRPRRTTTRVFEARTTPNCRPQ